MSAFSSSQPYPAPLPGHPGYQWGASIPAFPFANFGQRLLATLVDGLVVSAATLVPVVLGIVALIRGTTTTAAADGSMVTTVTNSGLFAVGIAALVIATIVGILYEPLMLARKGAHNGQTLGKQALGIRVTNLQGGPISAGQAWGRFLFASFVSKNILYLGFFWMLWDPMKQAWHDKIANTLVLDARRVSAQGQ